MAVSPLTPPPFPGLQIPVAPPRGTAAAPRRYRLVDGAGNPHPVLDDLYDSLELAWSEAMSWWGDQQRSGSSELQSLGPVDIGVEVSTSCGSWRTLRHPGC